MRVCGLGGQRREGGVGPDADVSAVTLVAIEQQQGLPFPFTHWLATLTTRHVVWASTNQTEATLLRWSPVLKRQRHILSLFYSRNSGYVAFSQ